MQKINKTTYALAVVLVLAATTAWSNLSSYFTEKEEVAVVSTDESNSFLSKITEEFKKIENKDDKATIYKLFAGAASYLEVCESLDGTYQFDPILARVQNSYGWNREKYPDFTDAVSNYLVDVNYDDPKPLTTKQERLDFAKIFKNLAEATKHE
ncbi:MAG: hypothetical protein CL833_05040 [Crocinitomicaceae bacterium]|nr:hypothetical protein [Crocinitomicaceae bacterium]